MWHSQRVTNSRSEAWHVLADAGDGDLEEALALGRFEENPLFLRQSVPDAAIADPAARRLAAAEAFDVVLVRLGHA
jgi:hypothetical protein